MTVLFGLLLHQLKNMPGELKMRMICKIEIFANIEI